MDEDWAPILIKDDCLFSAVACGSTALDFCFGNIEDETSSGFMSPSGTQHIFDICSSQRELFDFGNHIPGSVEQINHTNNNNNNTMISEQLPITTSNYSNIIGIKAEPHDETSNSDYTASFSQSQSCSPSSSSLSSPEQDIRDVINEPQYIPNSRIGVLGSPLAVCERLPSCTDARTQSVVRARELHTLPPVSHFSPTGHQQQTFDSSNFSERIDSPSPPSSDRSSPMEPAVHLGTPPYKARSKMHEMAVKQRLITDQDPRGSGFIELSAEEKRTLIQEGYGLPTRLPLTKSEEEALKIVRRKIKNKLSAQESRRKRKEYMDTLEQRVQGYFNENTSLKSKVKQLEQSNRNLAMQLKKMQAALNAQNSNQPPPFLSAQVPLPNHTLK